MSMEIEVLKKDKTFLNDKNAALLNEIRAMKDEQLNLENKVLDLKNTKRKLKSELSQVSDLNKTKSLDEMLHSELDKIRTRSDEELKTQKKQMLEIHANEMKILREQADNFREQTERLDLKLKAKERQYDELMGEYRVIRSKLEGEVHELRGELKVKSFELERLNLYMEDTLHSNKRVMQDSVIINEKFDLLKNEYNRLESEYNRVSSELRAELSIKKESLSN